MITFIDAVFFFYIFVGLYMLSLFIFLFIPNRNKMFDYPKGKPEKVSIILPCYNEGKHIGEAIENLLNLEYPKEMIEIIVVDDLSTDNSVEVVEEYVKKYKNIRLIRHKKNSGGAAGPTNTGVKAARNDYIVVADADSFPESDALIKMIGFLQKEKNIGGVTCSILSKNPESFMQRLQQIEYFVISFNRRILDLVGAVYVTPGPFAVYKKETLVKAGLFDTKNLTQDIEMTWKLLSKGLTSRMCLAARTYSATPKNLKGWWNQRIRWNIGGLQCILKYRNLVFRKGMLGAFVIPFFSFSLFIGLFGLILFAYLMFRRIMISYLSTKYSIYASTAIVNLQDLTFSPSILNFLGFALFFLGAGFAIMSLSVMGFKTFRRGEKGNVFNVFFYLLVYLAIYPIVMLTSVYKLVSKTHSWGDHGDQ